MNRQLAYVFSAYFLGLPMNRLAAEGGPPGDATCVFLFFSFWLVCQRCRGVGVVFLLYIFNWHDELWDCSY